jgi:hypothetical protein
MVKARKSAKQVYAKLGWSYYYDSYDRCFRGYCIIHRVDENGDLADAVQTEAIFTAQTLEELEKMRDDFYWWRCQAEVRTINRRCRAYMKQLQ